MAGWHESSRSDNARKVSSDKRAILFSILISLPSGEGTFASDIYTITDNRQKANAI
jgi:hypothetical protein